MALIVNVIEKQEREGETTNDVTIFLNLLEQLQLLRTRDEHYARDSPFHKLLSELNLVDMQMPGITEVLDMDNPWSCYGGYMPLSVRMVELANVTFLKTLCS